jgi:hypothetical protein
VDSLVYTDRVSSGDYFGRFRTIISDPINVLIHRVPYAGVIKDGMVFLHNGLSVPFEGDLAYYDNFSNILIYNRGVHEPLEELCFQEFLKKTGKRISMIELGAYWGHYSAWLKQLKPKSYVCLVEPEITHLEVGKANFLKNNFDATFINDFVGDGHFEIDDYFKKNNISQLDLLHSDIQGYELEMIYGAQNSLREYKIDYLMISTHKNKIHYSIIKFLISLGYVIEIDSNLDHSFSIDGFIFARSPTSRKIMNDWVPLGRTEIQNLNAVEISAYLQDSIKILGIL